MDYIYPSTTQLRLYKKSLRPYEMKISRLDPLVGDWPHCDRFLTFCKKYRSKFDELMEKYSRVGVYDRNVLINSLKIMTGVMKKPPKDFEALVIGHFRNRAFDILEACMSYEQGLRAGLVVGGVGNKGCCCSHEFREAVGLCIPELIDSFSKIGTNVDDYVTFLRAPTRVSLHGYISNTQ
ncbi:hypothetical protein Hanom_Chr03g00230501 [Helianthus anomalus]